MDSQVMGRLADDIWERMMQRSKAEGKHNRTDQGSGDPRIGAILRRYRQNYAQMSIRALADESGLDHTFIGRVEKGKRGMSVESLAALTAVLGNEFARDYLSGVYHVSNGYQFDSGHRPEDAASEPEVQAQPRIAEVDPGIDGAIIVSGHSSDCFLWVATGEDDTILGHSFVRLSDSQ